MIRQRLERSLVRKLHDAGTRCPSRWVSNVLSQFVPQEIAQTQGRWSAMNLPLALSKVPPWPHEIRDLRLARRSTRRVQQSASTDDDRVRPRHYR